MAEQIGLLQLKGTIGGFTFYERNGKKLARQKSSLDRDRFYSLKSMENTRKYNSEFGHCSRFGKLIRYCVSGFKQFSTDTRVCVRLVALLKKIILTDKVSPLGSRRLYNGDLSKLKGFDFNESSLMDNIFYADYTIDIVRSSGRFKLSIPSFKIRTDLKVPKNAQFFKMYLTAGEIICEKDDKINDVSNSGFIEVNDGFTNDIELQVSLNVGSSHPLIAVLGIEFYEEVNGELLQMRGGEHNPMQIIEVSQ